MRFDGRRTKVLKGVLLLLFLAGFLTSLVVARAQEFGEEEVSTESEDSGVSIEVKNMFVKAAHGEGDSDEKGGGGEVVSTLSKRKRSKRKSHAGSLRAKPPTDDEADENIPKKKGRRTRKIDVADDQGSESGEEREIPGRKKGTRKGKIKASKPEKEEGDAPSDGQDEESDVSTARTVEIGTAEDTCSVDADLDSTGPLKLSCGLGQVGGTPGLDRAFYRNPDRFQKEVFITETGAIRTNQLFHEGKSDKWHAAHQLCGADFVQSGLVQQDERMVQRGLFALQWALANLEDVDDFSAAGGDPSARLHLSLFFEAVGRAAVLLRSGGQCEEFVSSKMMPFLLRFGKWGLDPENSDSVRGLKDRANVLLARAAGYAYLTDLLEESDDDYHWAQESCKAYSELALSLIEDGFFGEAGNFNLGVQSSSIVFCARLAASTRSAVVRVQALNALEAAVKRLHEFLDIDEEGNVNITEPKVFSNSVEAVEKSTDRTSTKKGTPDLKPVIQGFFYAATLLGSDEAHERARQVANFKYKLFGERAIPEASNSLRWISCFRESSGTSLKKGRPASRKDTKAKSMIEEDKGEDGTSSSASNPQQRKEERESFASSRTRDVDGEQTQEDDDSDGNGTREGDSDSAGEPND